MANSTAHRAAFRDAAGFFAGVVAVVPPERWDGPGLGVWTLRELIAHAFRGLTTFEEYAARPAPDAAPNIETPVEYFVRALSSPGANEAVAQRGRDAARTLPAGTVSAVQEAAVRIPALVDTLPDSRVLEHARGTIRLGDYLPVRTLELTVHTLDIAEATGLRVTPPATASAVVFELLAGLARHAGKDSEAILALTGRRPWAGGQSVLG